MPASTPWTSPLKPWRQPAKIPSASASSNRSFSWSPTCSRFAPEMIFLRWSVVSNPPYVSQDDRPTLMREVRDHEPAQALFAGEAGAEVYARLIPQAARALEPGGFLVLELGHDSQEMIAALLSSPEGEKQWDNMEWRRDLAGIVRAVCARRAHG